MTMHTPVVLTDDESMAQAARSRGWPVVRRVGDRLHLTGTHQTAPIPEERMRIEEGSLSSPHAAGWAFVLAWLEKYLHRPAIVTGRKSWAGELALWAAASRGWPFRFTEDLSDLPDVALLDEPHRTFPVPVARRRDGTNVLLVSHDPNAPRTRSWLAAAGGGIEVQLASASDSLTPAPQHVVPDLGPANLATGRGEVEPAVAVAFSHAVDSPFDPAQERAGHWQHALERHFEARHDHFDVIVITDAPACSGFAAWAQRNWYARTVLDRPRPYALARDRGLPEDALALAVSWERGWAMAADAVVVPSETDVELQVSAVPGFRIHVLPDDDVDGMAGLLRDLGDHTYTRA